LEGVSLSLQATETALRRWDIWNPSAENRNYIYS